MKAAWRTVVEWNLLDWPQMSSLGDALPGLVATTLLIGLIITAAASIIICTQHATTY